MTPASKRRWFRFSLRTLLVVVTVSAIVFGFGGWTLHQVRERERFYQSISPQGALTVLLEPDGPPMRPLPFLWRTFIAKPLDSIDIPKQSFTDSEIEHIGQFFPEAAIRVY